MKTNQIYLVKDSFNLVVKIPAETIGELFYNRLFEIAPEIRPMFGHTDMSEQSRKLITMLTYIVKRLDDFDAIKGEIAKLAQRHVRYGVVEPRLYEPVGEALIWTLEQSLGTNWTNEVRTAWTVCYIMLSNAMIEACELIEV
jgi:hemoglobin-like flavoprotein